MAQFARPDADIVDGNWVGSDGNNVDNYLLIDESAFDDADYIQSGLAPSSEACALGLSNVTDPLSSINHTFRYRYGKDAAAGAQIDITVQLRQGYVSEGVQGTLIHSEVHTNVASGFTAGSFTLSAGEADSITDYTDLQIRLVANQV